MIKDSFGRRIFVAFNTIILFLLMVVAFYPLLYVLFASFSNSFELMKHKGILFAPIKPTFDAYINVFKNELITTGYINTLIIVFVGTGINFVLTVLGAFFFSRRNVALQKPFMLLVVFTMFFHGGMIPNYFLVRSLGLLNTLWAVMLPGAISVYNMLILRSGFKAVPVSLEESAMLDGAGPVRTLINVVLPLSMNIIAVIILYYAVAHWNAWFNASIYLKQSVLYPLQLVLRGILIVNDTSIMSNGVNLGDVDTISETIKYAVIVVSTLPILCVYPFLQRYFVKGVMTGAEKG